jgi:multidrug transporter EmrE-like cation transporter
LSLRFDVWLTLIASVALSATAQLFLKLGARKIAGASALIDLFRSAALSPPIWGGLALYGLSVALWIRVLSKLDLSVAYPFVGLGFLMTMAFGAIFLAENVSLTRIMGTALVAVGCILVARSA